MPSDDVETVPVRVRIIERPVQKLEVAVVLKPKSPGEIPVQTVPVRSQRTK